MNSPGWSWVSLLAAVMFLAQMAGYMMPLLVGATIESAGLDAGQAGMLGTLEFGTGAVLTLVISPYVNLMPLRHLLIAAILLTALAQFASALAGSFELLAVFRIFVGIGEGGFLAIANALIATSTCPESVYGRVAAIMAAGFALLLFVLPAVVERGGHAALYTTLGMMPLLFLPLVRHIPSRISAAMPRAAAASQSATSLQVVLLAVAVSVLYMTQGGMYSLAERIGHGAGVDSGRIGVALGLSAVAGIAGASLAGWLGVRYGRLIPMATGILLSGLSCLTLGTFLGDFVYITTLLIYGFTFMFTVAYVFGLAAALDPLGRLAVGTAGFINVSYAAGPAIFGYLSIDFSYTHLGLATLVLCILAAGLVTRIVVSMDLSGRVYGPINASN